MTINPGRQPPTGRGGRHARPASPLARALPAFLTVALLALGAWGGLVLRDKGPNVVTLDDAGGSLTPLTATPEPTEASPSPTAGPATSETPTPEPTTPSPTAPPASSAPPPAPPQPPATSGLEPYEQQVVDLVNDERAAAGCGPLTVDSRLVAAARAHSADMAARNYFDHTTPEGVTFAQRITQAGFAWSSAAENIAAGYRDPQSVMDGWMRSDGHRRNILNCRLTHIGVGLAYDANNRPYWTQDFATPR